MLRRTLLLLVVILLPACGPLTFTVGSSPSGKIAQTLVEEAGWASDRVAVIDVTGLIHNSASVGILSRGENPVGYLHERLEAARGDRRVKAVVLRLNTPGGTVTASDAMYREVVRFRKLSGKPVVAMMMDVAASGGYYLACGTDRIVAYPTSVTGSIGVIMQTFSIKGLLDRWDIDTDAITSGPNKAMGSPLDTLGPEHRAILQGMVDDFYSRFVAVVKENRPAIPPDKFASATDGRVFTGEQAKALGLVDVTGDLYDAFAIAKELAHLEKADLVVLHREGDFKGSAYAAAPPTGATVTQFNLAQINLEHPLGDATEAFLYLWRPEP